MKRLNYLTSVLREIKKADERIKGCNVGRDGFLLDYYHHSPSEFKIRVLNQTEIVSIVLLIKLMHCY
jgi:hypothetical protein